MATFYCKTGNSDKINIVKPNPAIIGRCIKWVSTKSDTNPGIGKWMMLHAIAWVCLFILFIPCEAIATVLTPFTGGLSHFVGVSLPVIIFYNILLGNLSESMWLCAHGQIPESLIDYFRPKSESAKGALIITIAMLLLNLVGVALPILVIIPFIMKIVTQPTIGFIKANYPEYSAGDIVKKQVEVFTKNWVYQVVFNLLTSIVMLFEIITLFSGTIITRPIMHAVFVYYHGLVFGEVVDVDDEADAKQAVETTNPLARKPENQE
ncbi:hypothetical protein J8273_7844 [Carpediemonas membranifera]|uniref:Uncharacterized protein n=1 Tax=Carpediemonas membranifera TaxID=201153 RepID=A0A8J6AQ43_9EUKA|nr:hypothetical protein J8273_7844 [Carpediemonas membranifera]|eukprot:KAG9390493.1 hypothetical protein J8273_7844 [Carpediemonas membranifera]